MIASLPMYERPGTRDVHDRLWTLIRTHLGYGPHALTRGENLADLWRSPDLLLSQSCSLPFRLSLHEHLDIVASPIHDLPCEPGYYFSVLVVRHDERRSAVTEFAQARIAVNAFDSHSGWAALPAELRATAPLLTGSHAASVQAVADGRADLASIDAVTWGLLEPEGLTGGLRVLDTTASTPALPYVTRRGNDIQALRNALELAIAALSDSDRKMLNLLGVSHVPTEEYLSLPTPVEACQMPVNP